jgi:hypothetical protein
LLDRADTELLHAARPAPLDRIQHFLLATFEDLKGQPARQQALVLMNFKCEYVDRLEAELAGMLDNTRVLSRAFETAYRAARADGSLRRGIDPRLAAMETVAFMGGLVRLWLLDGSATGFRKSAPDLIGVHLDAKRRS